MKQLELTIHLFSEQIVRFRRQFIIEDIPHNIQTFQIFDLSNSILNYFFRRKLDEGFEENLGPNLEKPEKYSHYR